MSQNNENNTVPTPTSASHPSPPASMPPPHDARARPELRDRMAAELTDALYRVAPTALAGSTVMLSLIAVVVWSIAPKALAVGWIVFAGLVVALRLRQLRLPAGLADAPSTRRRLERFLAGSMAVGTVFGAASFLAFCFGSLLEQGFIALMIAIIAASAVATMSCIAAAYRALVVPALVPVVLGFFSTGTQIGILAGSAMCLLLITMLAVTDRVGAVYRRDMNSRLENEHLVADLRDAAKYLANANRTLAREMDERQVAATAFESQECILITDARGVVQRVNAAFTATTGYSAAEIVGRTPALLRSGLEPKEMYDAMWETLAKEGMWRGEVRNRRKDGEIYPARLTITAVRGLDGVVTHYVGNIHDISAEKRAEEQIRSLADFDPLTRLPNRRLLTERLRQATLASERTRNFGAVLFIDLDNFKSLNDTLGHDAGDRLLVEVAQRLRNAVREPDTVARIGGDEFVVMLVDLEHEPADAANAVRARSEHLRRLLTAPYDLGGREFVCTPSIGVTLFRGSEVAVEGLLKQADFAMYQAKTSGRNAVYFFDPSMRHALDTRAALEASLVDAVRRDELVLHLQPQVDRGGNVVTAEALVRWNHPERGMLSPAEFIPLAEETPLIVPISREVIELACRQIAKWAADPATAGLTLSINVSTRHFRHPEFTEQVCAALASCGADPHRLEIELTESLAMSDLEAAVRKMQVLKVLGVRFTLDDFGTGASSLAFLRRLPFDQVKIDRSFVRNVHTDADDLAIVRAVIAMAKSLGIAVVAEGVELPEQWRILRDLGCDRAQGYLSGHPMGVEEFGKRLTPALAESA